MNNKRPCQSYALLRWLGSKVLNNGDDIVDITIYHIQDSSAYPFMLIGGGGSWTLHPTHPGLMRVRIEMSWNDVLTWSKYRCTVSRNRSIWPHPYDNIISSEQQTNGFLSWNFLGTFITAWRHCTPSIFGHPVWQKTDFKDTFKCWGSGFVPCRYCLREAVENCTNILTHYPNIFSRILGIRENHAYYLLTWIMAYLWTYDM